MSQIQARLAALRAKREQSLSASAQPSHKTERAAGTHGTAHARLEWRARARQAASERIRRAALESGVYDVITRPLPKEKDDIAEMEKRKKEEAEAEVEDDEDVDEDGEEEDEEEAALERLERGILSDTDTRDADTRDADSHGTDTRDADTRDADTRDADTREADTRDADRRDGDAIPLPDDSSTLPDRADDPESAPKTDRDKAKNQDEEEQPVKDGDKHPPVSETGPSTPQQKPTVPISETGPEALTPPSDTPQEVTPPRNPFGMVEDEAEDDEDQEKNVDNGSPDLSGDEVNDIVPDADLPDADAVKLAEFHRKWEAEQMEPAAPRYDDLDDAMDFTDVKGVGEDGVGEDGVGEDGVGEDCVGEDGVSAEGGDRGGTDRADNYIDAMFLRDDSKSKVVDVDEEDAGDETTREKARALWKARQMFRTHLRDRDESNSLSRFDLFTDSRNRSADIRTRLEKSCRPAPLRDVTNVDKSKKRKLEPPEWARRKEILAEKERKRRRAVSVGNWSFTMHGKREEAEAKKTSARPSLGAAHLTKRSRTRKAATPPRSSPRVTAAPRRRRGATSFKDLLSVLGNQASVDTSR